MRGWSAARRYISWCFLAEAVPVRWGTTPCGAPLRCLSMPGPRFLVTESCPVYGQPAPGRRAVVPSGWDPGPSGPGMPAGRGTAQQTPSGLPRKYQGRISSPFFRPVPPSRRLMTAPLGGRGALYVFYPMTIVNSLHREFSERASRWAMQPLAVILRCERAARASKDIRPRSWLLPRCVRTGTDLRQSLDRWPSPFEARLCRAPQVTGKC